MIAREYNLADFHAVALPILLQREVENCILISPGDNPDTRGCAVFDHDRPVAFAIHTPGRHVFLSHGPAEAGECIARKALDWPDVRGAAGPMTIVRAFCQTYQRAAACAVTLHAALASHRLDRVIPPATVAGELSPMREEDAATIIPWTHEFSVANREVDPDPAGTFRMRLEKNRGFVWRINEKPVAMAGWAGPTSNGVRINAVYTPPENRNRGYASALVAALSQHLLDSGRKFTFLYTDLSNPVSNSIYRKIGYTKVAEAEHWMFQKKD